MSTLTSQNIVDKVAERAFARAIKEAGSGAAIIRLNWVVWYTLEILAEEGMIELDYGSAPAGSISIASGEGG